MKKDIFNRINQTKKLNFNKKNHKKDLKNKNKSRLNNSSKQKNLQNKKPTKKNISKPTKKNISKPVKKNVSEPTKKNISKPVKKNVSKPTKKNVSKPIKKNVSKQNQEIINDLHLFNPSHIEPSKLNNLPSNVSKNKDEEKSSKKSPTYFEIKEPQTINNQFKTPQFFDIEEPQTPNNQFKFTTISIIKKIESQNENENKNLFKKVLPKKKLVFKGTITKFNKPFLDRAFDAIRQDKINSTFIKYYNSIFYIRIIGIIILIVTLQTLVKIQVLFALITQLMFTFGVIYYSIISGFLKMSWFFILNRFILEISLTIFLIGATFLSYNQNSSFNETFLFILEIFMAASLALSIIIEILILLGTISLLFLKSIVNCTKCCKKKTNKVFDKKKEQEEKCLEEESFQIQKVGIDE